MLIIVSTTKYENAAMNPFSLEGLRTRHFLEGVTIVVILNEVNPDKSGWGVDPAFAPLTLRSFASLQDDRPKHPLNVLLSH